MRTIKFTGYLKSIEPIYITLPDTDSIPKSDGKPIIPASSIRGMLRHNAHKAITELLFVNEGTTLSVDDHYLLASGVDTARITEKSGSSTVVGRNLGIRNKNPFLSLFGYWKLPGVLSVGNAIATSTDAIEVQSLGARNHVFKRDDNLSAFVDPDELEYLQDILLADSQSSQVVSEYKREIARLWRELKSSDDKDRKIAIRKEVDLIDQRIRKEKDARVGSSESIQRPLDIQERIKAGETFPHRMMLKNPSDTELELYLWCIAMSSVNPYIGGRSNANYGLLEAHWEVSELSIDNLKPKKIGVVGFNEDGFYSTIEGFDPKAVSDKIKSNEINVKVDI